MDRRRSGTDNTGLNSTRQSRQAALNPCITQAPRLVSFRSLPLVARYRDQGRGARHSADGDHERVVASPEFGDFQIDLH